MRPIGSCCKSKNKARIAIARPAYRSADLLHQNDVAVTNHVERCAPRTAEAELRPFLPVKDETEERFGENCNMQPHRLRCRKSSRQVLAPERMRRDGFSKLTDLDLNGTVRHAASSNPPPVLRNVP